MTPEWDPDGAVNLGHRDPLPILSIRGSATIAALANAQGECLHQLWNSFQSRGMAPAGPPIIRYHSLGARETDMEVGVPVRDGAAGEGRINAGELPGGPVITTWHLGAHDRLGEAYGRLAAWLAEHERETAGPAWEVYWWIDPSQKPDPSAWPPPTQRRTELVQPLAVKP